MVTLIRLLCALSVALFLLSLNRAQASIPPPVSSPDASPENALGAEYHGALVGRAAVSAGGNASYSLAIDLPPGINGLRPQLSVNYNSNVGNGALGLGWFLGGASTSRITRCPQTMSQNGRVHAVDYSADDRFCLDGQQLVVVQGSYGDHWAVYRTESDSFARIESRDNAGGGPGWFIVRGKDGSIRHYGRQSDSRIEAEGVDQVRVWALDEVKDHSGNYYRLYYEESNADGSYALSQIQYTGNENSGAVPRHSINFDYENRRDNILQYRGGSKIRPYARRLAGIRIAYDGRPMTEYRLEYEEVGVDGRSRLTRIEHCDYSGECQDPIIVNWEDDGTLRYGSRSRVMPYTNMEGDMYGSSARTYTLHNGTSPRWHDMNGDGTLDYVHVVPGSWGQYTGLNLDFEILLSGPDGYQTHTWPSALSGAPTAFTWADLDGDGMTDVLRPWGTGSNARLDIAFSTGDGLAMATWSMPSRVGTASYRDMNGDKLLDLVIRSRTRQQAGVGYWGVFVYLNEGDGFGAEQLWIDELADGVELIDMNGDGQTDVLWQDRYVYFSDGTGFESVIDFGSAGYQQQSVYLDYNGDGLPDRSTRASGGGCCIVELNTGNGFVYAGYSSRYAVLDIDRNGVNDAFTRSTRLGLTDVDLYFATDGEAGDYHRVRSSYKGKRDFFFQVADINGDGLGDFALAEQRVCRTWSEGGESYIVYCEDDVHTLVESQSKPLQLVSSITSGRAVAVRFSYRPLTDHSIYTRGNGARMPHVDVQDGTYVVTQFDRADGIGGEFTTTYRYEGLKRDPGGRGNLGFARITATNLDKESTTITDYAQTYPYPSQPVRVDVVQSDSGRLLSRSETTYGVRGTVGIGYVAFPFVAERRDYRYDPESGELLSTTTTTNEVDVFGNTLVSEQLVTDHTMSNTFTTRTDNTFLIDASWVWRPGQLVTSTVRKWRNGTSSEPDGLTRTFKYDNASGLLINSVRQPGAGGGVELATTLTRDVSGNILSETVSGSGITARTRSFTYDLRQQFPIGASNPKGHLTHWTWDGASGLKLSETDSNGLVTLWEYDSFGRQVRETRPDATTTTTRLYQCSSADLKNCANYLETVSSSGGPTRVFHDALGRTLRTRTRAFSGAYVNRDIEYDSSGRAFRYSEPYFEGEFVPWNNRSFDSSGRVTALDAADDTRSVTTRYNGFDSTVTDALGRTATRQLNAIGQVIATIDQDGTGLALTYDSQGNRVQATTAVMSQSQSSVSYSYDILGRVITQVDPNHGVYLYRYDALGQRLSEQSPKMSAANQKVTYKYDTLGRLIRRVEPEGKTTWSYDYARNGNLGIGQLYREVQSGFTRIHLHDKGMYGRLSSTKTIIDGTTYNASRAYDTAGRLSMERGPASPLAGPGYSVHYIYNSLGFLERITEAGGNVVYQLLETDAAGRDTGYWLGDGSTTRLRYEDESARITYQETVNEGSPFQHFEYTYDDAGTMSARSDEIHGVHEGFEYDQLSRLESWQVSGKSELTADYSRSGNIVSKSDYGRSYEYDSDRVNAVTKIESGTQVLSLAYDVNGNFAGGTNMPDITWSSYNKPVRLTRGNVDYTFSYGPQRSRYRKERNGYLTHYVGGNFERNWLDTTEEFRHIVRANGRAVMVRRELAGGVTNLYLHRDHLGSVATVTRESDGKVLERYSYDPWGKRRSASNWSTPVNTTQWMRRGYTGHEHLDDLGLVHMNGRIYHPGIGRMLSPDPVTQSPEEGRTYNRYSYTYNNPLNLTDPSGYQAEIKDTARPEIPDCVQYCYFPRLLDDLLPGFAPEYRGNDGTIFMILNQNLTQRQRFLNLRRLVYREQGIPEPALFEGGDIVVRAGDSVSESGEPVANVPVDVRADVDATLGVGYGAQVFSGFFGVSLNVSVVASLASNGVCMVTTGCFQVGVGIFGGMSVNTTGVVTSEPISSGISESVGVFVSAGSGVSTVGSADVGADSSFGVTKYGVGPGQGIAVGLQFCRDKYDCVGVIQ